MSADRILARIKAEAGAEAQAIRAEGAAEVAAILAEGREQAAALKARLVAQAKAAAEEEARRALSLAKLEARKRVLQHKQEAVTAAFDRAAAAVAGLPDPAYRAFLKRWLLKAAVAGPMRLVLSPRDKGRFAAADLAEVNRALERTGRGPLTPDPDTRETGAGFILVDPDIEINHTLASELKTIRAELEPLVAEALFGSQEGG